MGSDECPHGRLPLDAPRTPDPILQNGRTTLHNSRVLLQNSRALLHNGRVLLQNGRRLRRPATAHRDRAGIPTRAPRLTPP
ncbi:hypothetical protein GCM10027408_13180 [Microbacterium tumbae]